MATTRIFILGILFSFICNPVDAKKKLSASTPRVETGMLNSNALHSFMKEDTLVNPINRPVVARKIVKKDSLIFWNTRLDFNWNMYTAKAKKTDTGLAYTCVDIQLNCTPVGQQAQANFLVVMVANKSWQKYGTSGSIGNLIHEKVHFNIAELYARKMRKECHDMQIKGMLTTAAATTIYQALKVSMQAYQLKYEQETQAGKATENQQKWNLSISSQLAELSLYASDKQ